MQRGGGGAGQRHHAVQTGGREPNSMHDAGKGVWAARSVVAAAGTASVRPSSDRWGWDISHARCGKGVLGGMQHGGGGAGQRHHAVQTCGEALGLVVTHLNTHCSQG